MEQFNEICNYLYNKDNFNDNVYQELINSFGCNLINDFMSFILSNRNTYLELYKKIIGNNNSNYDMVIDRLLLPRVKEIKLNICHLISQCGVNTDEITLLGDKIEYAKMKINDKDTLDQIDSLYCEFIIIRNRIFNYYQYLVDIFFEKYDDDIKYDDVYQEACICFLTSIEKYDASKYTFKGYISSVIQYGVSYHYHDLDLCLRVPTNRRHTYYKMLKIIQDYVNKYHMMPKKEYLMKQLNISKKMITVFLSLTMNDTISLSDSSLVDDEYIKNDEIIGNTYDIRSLEDKAICDSFDSLLAEVFNELTLDEQTIIYDYYLADNRLELGQITKKLGVSYTTGGNYKRRALAKLRKYKDEFGKYLR